MFYNDDMQTICCGVIIANMVAGNLADTTGATFDATDIGTLVTAV